MQPLKNISIILLSSVLLGGCAGTYKPITDLELQNYQTATIISNIPQQGIRLQIVPSNSSGLSALQFGPVGGMPGTGNPRDMRTNRYRTRKAERKVKKFQIALGNDGISQKISLDLNDKIQHLPWAKVIEFEKTSVSGKDLFRLPLKRRFSSDVLILINIDYSFTPHFQTIEFTADYSIYAVDENGNVLTKVQKRAHDRKEPKSFYLNQVIYQAKIFPAAGSTRKLTTSEIEVATREINTRYESKVLQEKNRRAREQLQSRQLIELKKLNRKEIASDASNIDGALWLHNNAELTKQALVDGSKEIVKLIIMDLSGEANDLEKLKVVSGNGIKTYLVSKDKSSDREIYRLREGWLAGKLLSKTSKYDYLIKTGRQ